MVFTPLLSSATVGTIESRCVAVNITDIQKALFQPQNNLYIAQASAVFPDRKVKPYCHVPCDTASMCATAMPCAMCYSHAM